MRDRAEEAWRRLKRAAQECAVSGAFTPAPGACAVETERVLRTVYGADHVSSEAFEFYCKEFEAMVRDLRARKPAPK